VPSGVFKGRLAALYMSSTSVIKLTFSDYPHENWSTPQTIVSNSNDSPFSAYMDKSGNIHLVYTDSSKDIKYLEISFAAGEWSPGSAVDVITVDDNYNPFFLMDADDKFWCLFVNHNRKYQKTKAQPGEPGRPISAPRCRQVRTISPALADLESDRSCTPCMPTEDPI